jgi:L-asparaginase
MARKLSEPTVKERAYSIKVRALGATTTARPGTAPDLDTPPFPVTFHPDSRDQAKLRENRERILGVDEDNLGVLVIYSGGTIGSAPNDPEDPQSPQVVKSWPDLVSHFPPFSQETPYALNFRLDAVSFDEPLDSSNMGPTEWNAVALLLKEYMDDYEGFVIAHGTDTMVYSASALSFMLEHLKKPVILTGSQLSAIGNVRNDAQQNLITSIMVANWRYSRIPKVPEVCILFGDQLLRGNRSIKVDASGYAAYETPNYEALGTAGAKIVIHEDRVRQPDHQQFSVNERLDTNVMDVVVFPGIQGTELLTRILEIPELRAVVLRTFGAGNTPTPQRFLEQLEVARQKEIIVVNVTQCAQGSVEMGLYETSAVLMKYGVVSGIDCTPVAALTKLMVLLGDDRLSQEEVAQYVQSDLRGEQSESIFVTPMRLEDASGDATGVSLTAESRVSRMLTARDLPHLDDDHFRHASLILHSARVVAGERQRVDINVYINVARDELLHVGHGRLACSASRLAIEDGTLVFDISAAMEKHIDVLRKNAFTIELASPEGEVAWSGAELALHTATA